MCQERCREHLGTEVALELDVLGIFVAIPVQQVSICP
jgi:hypothetical protein